MSRARLALVIAFYAVVAAVGAVFMGTSVPPCFGRVPDGRMSQACIDHWLASRSPVEWLFSSPWTAVGFLVVASGLTIWWSRRQARRRSPRAS
jgi:hypothetical protein